MFNLNFLKGGKTLGKQGTREIIKSLFPAILFMVLYKNISFRVALIVAFAVGIVVYSMEYKKNRKLTSMDKLGIFGLITQTIMALFANNPKTYFIYPLIENVIFAIIFFGSLFLKMDAVTYISQDFTEGEALKELIPLHRKLTTLWGIYYILKAVIKVIGLMSWSFDTLYWVSWITGTPMFIVLIWASFHYPRKAYKNVIIKDERIG